MNKLTVLMPIKNKNKFLKDSLDSLSNQTYKDYFVIFICPTLSYDNLKTFLEEYSPSFDYKLIHTPLDGISFAANLGISHCNSELVARWDSDDICDPLRFERQIQEFNNIPQLAIVGTKVILIDENGNEIKHHKFKFFGSSSQIRYALRYRQPLLHSSLMFKRDILFRNKGYLYGNTSEDHELFIRIARDKKIIFKNIPDVITFYRRHNEQISDVENMNNQFYEVSGFLFTEFLRTWNIIYIIGIIANIPLIRKSRYLLRFIKSTFYKVIN